MDGPGVAEGMDAADVRVDARVRGRTPETEETLEELDRGSGVAEVAEVAVVRDNLDTAEAEACFC